MGWAQIGWVLLKTLGTVLGSFAMSLLTGKTFKTLLLYPLRLWANKSPSKLEKTIEAQAEKDLGINLDSTTGDTK